MSTEKDSNPALLEGRQIRKAFHEGEWWFAGDGADAEFTEVYQIKAEFKAKVESEFNKIDWKGCS